MFYLKAKKIDFSTGTGKIILLNAKTLVDEGLEVGARLLVKSPKNDVEFIVTIDQTEKLVSHSEVGIEAELIDLMQLGIGDIVGLDVVPQPKSIEAIRKKLLKKDLNYTEIKSVLEDIISGKLDHIQSTYFAACGFNPGFSDQELYFLTKAMAQSGQMIKWPYEKVIDKHSIGGIAGKGITPIVVSIIASRGLVIPNTSTKAITAPAGTTDVMSVFCNMEFSKDEVVDLIRKNNACMVWGGGLDLAPADEAIIELETPIGIETYDKFTVSILAKKIAMGLTHYVLDLPTGPETKAPSLEEAHQIKNKFEKLSEQFGIKVKVIDRHPLGPDGRGVGPCLEARDILYVLMDRKDRYLPLEDTALSLAGELLELADEAKPGTGYEIAHKELKSGKALKKFLDIIEAQGGNRNIQPEDIKLGEVTQEILATQNGSVRDISNTVLKEVCHALGTPNIKGAGIYFHKHVGEKFKEGDILFTMYTSSESRLDLAKKILEVKKLYVF